jgi:hypothetical protein
MTAQTTISDEELQALVYEILADHGFVRMQNKLYKEEADTTLLVTVQKSCCSSASNINLAVFIPSLVEAVTEPRSLSWGHLQTRLCVLSEDNDLFLALDIMEPMTDDERRAIIERAMKDFGLPWFDNLNSKAKIKSEIENGALNPKHHPLGSQAAAL